MYCLMVYGDNESGSEKKKKKDLCMFYIIIVGIPVIFSFSTG